MAEKMSLEELLATHAPTGEQQVSLRAIRAAAKALADVLVAKTPTGPEQTAALRQLRACVLTATAAIARQPITR